METGLLAQQANDEWESGLFVKRTRVLGTPIEAPACPLIPKREWPSNDPGSYGGHREESTKLPGNHLP